MKSLTKAIVTKENFVYKEGADPTKMAKFDALASNRYLVALFFAGLDEVRYSKLKTDMMNIWVVGRQDTVLTTSRMS